MTHCFDIFFLNILILQVQYGSRGIKQRAISAQQISASTAHLHHAVGLKVILVRQQCQPKQEPRSLVRRGCRLCQLEVSAYSYIPNILKYYK